jgi:type I restriction enzyme S subunit
MTLPKGWTNAKLGDFTLERVEQGEPGAFAVSYIDIGSIDRDLKRVGPTEKVTGANAPTRARQWVKPGDVLVSLTRPNLNAVAIVPPDLDGAVASTGFDVLRSEGVLPEWIFNRVRSQVFVSDVCEGVQGVVYPAIRPADVRRHDLPIPPAQEQQRIVEAIDSYLTRLDDAVANLDRVQITLKAYRASVLKAAVEGRLVPTEASLARSEKRSYEPAEVLLRRILKERRRRWEETELVKLKAARKTPKDDKWKAKYEEPVAPDTRTLPELPEGWCWVCVDQLGLVSGGLTQNANREKHQTKLPFLRVANVYANALVLDEIKKIGVEPGEIERARLSTGDLLIVEGNGSVDQIGRVALWDGSIDPILHQNHLIKFRCEPRQLSKWTLAWLLSPAGRAAIERVASSTSGLHTLSISKVGRLVVPLPPLAEQTRAFDEVDTKLSLADAVVESVLRDSRRCTRLRQSVLKWAFEGKLVDQDPTDEPADTLLARIRAERAADSPAKKTLSRRARGAA